MNTEVDRVEQGKGRWQNWHSLTVMVLMVVFVLVEVLARPTHRFEAWLILMGLLTAFALVAGHGVTGYWLGVLIDSRNKVSLARLQMIAWTVVILSALLTAIVINVDVGKAEPLDIVIPPDLWVLMGISTTSLIGSPLLVAWKKGRTIGDEERTSALTRLEHRSISPDQVSIVGQIIVNRTPAMAGLSDIFQGSETGNAGQLDLGKLQMLFFSLVLVLGYGFTVGVMFRNGNLPITSLPGLETGILALLGISHAGYLVNKALPNREKG